MRRFLLTVLLCWLPSWRSCRLLAADRNPIMHAGSMHHSE